MTDDSHRRPDDHLVEPMFAAFHPPKDGSPEDRAPAPAEATRRGCLGGAAAVLLLAAWCATVSCAPRGTGPRSEPWFEEVAADVGLDFRHRACATGRFALPEIMGAGCALIDVDGDGRLDAYFTNGAPTLVAEWDGAAPRNRLYVQREDGTFRDATEASGLGDEGYGMGVAAGDVDADGDLDLYLTNFGPDRLYVNEGGGRFRDATEDWGAGVEGWSTSAEFADFDRDGHLDLFVVRYVEFEPERACRDAAGRPDYCGPKTMAPVADVLLRNRGDGTFEDVSASAGIAARAAAGLGVVWEDLDDDGWLDACVANDAYANHLWHNRGDGTFEEWGLRTGLAFNNHGVAEAGMGVAVGDFDGDGRTDLFMTHLENETNTLYRNEGAAGFRDVTGTWGLSASVPTTGFGTAACDLELDGDLDLVAVNGRVFRGEVLPGVTLPRPWALYAEPNLVHVNDGAGRFRDAGDEVAALRDLLEISRGLAAGDVDGDGDLDLLQASIEGPARLFRNVAPRAGAWLAVRAVEGTPARDALGARVEVVAGERRWRRTLRTGSSYQSACEPEAHFGLGPVESIDHVEVRWPDGARERFAGGAVDRRVVLRRGEGTVLP